MKKTILFCCLFGVASSASATMITDNTGFDGDDYLVTFDEVAIAGGVQVTDQFLPYGVGFYPHLKATSDLPVSDFSGQSIMNASPVVDPFTIYFSQAVDAFGAYWQAYNGTELTFKAKLGGLEVDSFVYTETACCGTSSFLGFDDIVFDSVVVNTTGEVVMDNLQASAAPVPEPASLALIGLGLAGMGFSRKKKKA
jgi:hypothetical protein